MDTLFRYWEKKSTSWKHLDGSIQNTEMLSCGISEEYQVENEQNHAADRKIMYITKMVLTCNNASDLVLAMQKRAPDYAFSFKIIGGSPIVDIKSLLNLWAGVLCGRRYPLKNSESVPNLSIIRMTASDAAPQPQS